MPPVGPHEPVLDRFAEHLRAVRNRAPSTVADCRHYVACFLGWWLDSHGDAALARVRPRHLHDPHKRCSVSALERECRVAAAAAGIPGRHYPHRWRHSYATELIRAGMGVAQVQRQLGHASIVSTMPAHLDVEDVRRSLDEVFDDR